MSEDIKEYKLDLNMTATPITPDLKMKAQVSQVNVAAVSELIFNTGHTDLDRDLPVMFKQLALEEQAMYEKNGGKGEVQNLFVNIMQRTQSLQDHKILPKEAVMLMFRIGTTVSLDHTLLKDGKLTKEELEIKSHTNVLDNSIDSMQAMMDELDGKVAANNKSTAPVGSAKPELDTSDILADLDIGDLGDADGSSTAGIKDIDLNFDF